ncbi:MAG: ACP S-malonyltransferase [Blastocatellia bacterium]
MITLLIDHNIEGQARTLWRALQKASWVQTAEIAFSYFAEVGLPHDSSDRQVWRFVQRRGMFLLTANRNNKDADSLAQTILDENTLTALPVLTVGNADRVKEPEYSDRCINRLLEIVLYPEKYLGTGRQFIP